MSHNMSDIKVNVEIEYPSQQVLEGENSNVHLYFTSFEGSEVSVVLSQNDAIDLINEIAGFVGECE